MCLNGTTRDFVDTEDLERPWPVNMQWNFIRKQNNVTNHSLFVNNQLFQSTLNVSKSVRFSHMSLVPVLVNLGHPVTVHGLSATLNKLLFLPKTISR